MDVSGGGTAGQDQRMTAFEFDGVVHITPGPGDGHRPL